MTTENLSARPELPKATIEAAYAEAARRWPLPFGSYDVVQRDAFAAGAAWAREQIARDIEAKAKAETPPAEVPDLLAALRAETAARIALRGGAR